MHRCWRGLEHVLGNYNKGARTTNYVRNTLALQSVLRAKADVANRPGSQPNVSIVKALKVACRFETKDDRKRAFRLAQEDAADVGINLADVYEQLSEEVEKETLVRNSRLSFHLSPLRRAVSSISPPRQKPAKSSFARRTVSFECAIATRSFTPNVSSV